MAITGFNESSLATSEVFQGLAKLSGSDPKEKAINLIRTAKKLTNEDIEAAYIQLKQYSNGLSRAALRAFDDETIILLYNSVPSLSITQALPFITFKTKDGYKTYVFMDKYVRINKSDIMEVQVTVLHDLLVGALLANRLKTNYAVMASNQYLQKTFLDIYVQLFRRILNRDYSIASIRKESDICQYFISRFFLTHVFGANETEENIETLAVSGIKALDELTITGVKNQYDEANPSNLSELLDLLKTVTPRMKTLALGTFLSGWVNYYYIPSMLAVDTMEYLIFMVLTLLSGNNIISIQASDIVKETKNIKVLREELLKVIEN
jgi:hypothetical protein